MRKQLRPFYTPHELAVVYNHDYQHEVWPAHVERVEKTIQVLDEFALSTNSSSVADLSAGDGAILQGSQHHWGVKVLGDLRTTGPIEETLAYLHHVDMFVLSETLEHVEDPDNLLAAIRVVADNLVLTTPCGEVTDENPEHYWGWDQEGLDSMLDEAGWMSRQSTLFTPVSNDYYTFQIWTCS